MKLFLQQSAEQEKLLREKEEAIAVLNLAQQKAKCEYDQLLGEKTSLASHLSGKASELESVLSEKNLVTQSLSEKTAEFESVLGEKNALQQSLRVKTSDLEGALKQNAEKGQLLADTNGKLEELKRESEVIAKF